MRKYEFLQKLREGLASRSEEEILAACSFYSELIDDRVEDGMAEQDAVADIGDPVALAAQVLDGGVTITESSPPVPPPKHAAVEKRRLSVGWIVAIAVSSIVWLPLAIAFAAVVFALLVAFWAVILALFAVAVSLVGAGFAGIAMMLYYLPQQSDPALYGGMLLCCIGLGIFATAGMCYVVKWAAKGTAWLFKSIFVHRRGKK